MKTTQMANSWIFFLQKKNLDLLNRFYFNDFVPTPIADKNILFWPVRRYWSRGFRVLYVRVLSCSVAQCYRRYQLRVAVREGAIKQPTSNWLILTLPLLSVVTQFYWLYMYREVVLYWSIHVQGLVVLSIWYTIISIEELKPCALLLSCPLDLQSSRLVFSSVSFVIA